MRTTSETPGDVELVRQRRSAARFFWLWLITATTMSVTGNVAHAVLHADSSTIVLAAGAALVTGIQRYQNGPNTSKAGVDCRSNAQITTLPTPWSCR